MLKAVSSTTNAIGALNYKGTWNANTNSPALASGAGTKGDYYQVSVAGSTALDGVSNWGVGDVAAFNGVTWQRVEGGADLNGVNLSVTGNSDMGNIRVAGNTISSTNTNGNLNLDPNGSGSVEVLSPMNVSGFLEMLTSNGDAPKTGVKWVEAQSQIDNPTIQLLTAASSPASRVLIVEVTVYQAGLGTEIANVQRGYARIRGDTGGTIYAMSLVQDMGTANLGTLAWNGRVLEYTTNRATNYDTYSIQVIASGSLPMTSF